MEDLDRLLDDFTNPATGSLHGAVFLAVDKSGTSMSALYFDIHFLTGEKEILYIRKPLDGQVLTLMAPSSCKLICYTGLLR